MLRASSKDRPSACTSRTRLSSISAAGWASHVGYQNDRISRFVWKREPAPPSKPSNEGACKNNVFIDALKENYLLERDQSPAGTRRASAMFRYSIHHIKNMPVAG